jgi:hypothetical protein
MSESAKQVYVTNPLRRQQVSQQSKEMWTTRKTALAAAQRPTGWDAKPIEWRIIGTELLLEVGYLSNKQLAARLDESKILRCPYADTWRAAAADENNRGFVLFISKVRKWVNKPGRVQRG